MLNIESKSATILCLLKVLEDHSSPDNPLSNGQVINYLNKEYGISITPNTLRSHLAMLSQIGYNISTFRDNRRGIYLEPGESEPSFDDEEIRVLIDSVLTSRYIPEHHASQLIHKLTRLASKHFPQQLTHIHPLNEWNHRRNKAFFWNLSCLAEAAEKGLQAEFNYNIVAADKSLKRKGGKARVHPYAVVASNGQYYLLCSLGRYDNLLHYRIDRMTDVKLRDKKARSIETMPGYEKGLNLARYSREHNFMYGGKTVQVVFRILQTCAGDVLDIFGEKATIKELEGGLMEVSVWATEEGMRFFALQFGPGGCEIISPQSLREQLKKEIDSLAKRYD